MKTPARFGVILAVAIAACTSRAGAPPDADLTWRPAVDLVLSAFEQHRLVAVSEGAGHGQLETRDFFAALIRDRRFAPTVRNVVIEFGNARYQAVMDRYVTGGPVTRDELRHVWEDTTQTSGVWSLPMYEQMLAHVRSVNEGLPPARRIRVIAGDPPIDWSAVTSPADEDMNDWRDAHFAHVIEREVMRRGERALILIGGAHISRTVMFPNSLIHLLDLRFPGQTWVAGVLDLERIEPDIRSRLRAITAPAGTSVRSTWLGKLAVRRIAFNLSIGDVENDVDARQTGHLSLRRTGYAHEITPGVVYNDANVTVAAFPTKHAMESYGYSRSIQDMLWWEEIWMSTERTRTNREGLASVTSPSAFTISVARNICDEGVRREAQHFQIGCEYRRAVEGLQACQPEPRAATSEGPPTRRFAATPTGSLRATGERTLLSRVFASWNQLEGWLRQVEALRTAA